MAASFDVPPVCYQVCTLYSLQHHPTLSHSLTGLHGLILSHSLTLYQSRKVSLILRGLHSLTLSHNPTLSHGLTGLHGLRYSHIVLQAYMV